VSLNTMDAQPRVHLHSNDEEVQPLTEIVILCRLGSYSWRQSTGLNMFGRDDIPSSPGRTSPHVRS
jgi:hypothetical protein